MGVAEVMSFLRNAVRGAPEMTSAEVAVAMRCPDCAALVDFARFMHAALSRLEDKANPDKACCTIVGVMHSTLAALLARSPTVADCALYLLIDDYNQRNDAKVATVAIRAEKVIAVPFCFDSAVCPTPLMTSRDVQGVYASNESRLCLYNRVAELMRYGRTVISEKPHCVSLDSCAVIELLQRVSTQTLVVDQSLPLNVTHTFDLLPLLLRLHGDGASELNLLGVPEKLSLTVHVAADGSGMHLVCTVDDATTRIWVHATVEELQYMPYRGRIDDLVVVVNVLSVGQFRTSVDGQPSFDFKPSIGLDVFKCLPCPQLPSHPMESDFSWIEFAVQLATRRFDYILAVFADSDWWLFASAVQNAIIAKGLPTTLLLHVCPSGRNPAPDMWLNVRSMTTVNALRASLMWYVLGRHDFSHGIASLGHVGQLAAITACYQNAAALPILSDPVNPGNITIDVAGCTMFARNALLDSQNGRKRKLILSLEDSITDVDGHRIPLALFIAGALHPIRQLVRALAPLL
jgi:hypothetical protein